MWIIHGSDTQLVRESPAHTGNTTHRHFHLQGGQGRLPSVRGRINEQAERPAQQGEGGKKKAGAGQACAGSFWDTEG